MDYTLSNAYATDAGTGNRMHQQSAAIPTAVTDLDMNSVLWSLMEIVKAAGLAGAQFDKATPATYQKLLTALRSAGVFTTPAQFDNTTKAATTAYVKAAGLQAAGFTSYGASTVLTNADIGKAIALYGAAPYMVTLPISNAANAGSAIAFTAQQGSAVLTIAGQSGQTIQMSGSAFSSIQFGVGDQMTLVSGGGGWYVMSVSGIGVGQRWKTPARAFNTTYTNTTGRPIYVGYTANFGGLADVVINVDGATQWYERVADSGSGTGWGCGGAIVPTGSTYAFSYTGTTTITGITFRELS